MIKQKRESADALLTQVGKEKLVVEEQNQLAQSEEAIIDKLVAQTEAFEEQCREELAEAEPKYLRAIAALNVLNKPNISELRAFVRPAPGIVDVVAAVMVLTSPPGRLRRDLRWVTGRKFMAKTDTFLALLYDFDRDAIPEENLEAVAPLLDRSHFTPRAMKKLRCVWCVECVSVCVLCV